MSDVLVQGASTPVSRAPNASTRRRRRGDGRAAALFLLPALIGFAVFYIYPAMRGTWYSLTKYNLLSPPHYVGLQNFNALVHDSQFWESLRVTVYFVFMTLISQLIVALVLAALLHRLTRSIIVRAVLLLPWLVPNVTIGLLWMWLLDTNLGFLNELIRALGGHTEGFLSSPTLALPSVSGITVWAGTGYVVLLFYAGMLQIPQHLYESAAIDGAGEIRTFFRITLPLLKPIIALVMVISVIGTFQVFDVIAVTTAGGPVNVTKVIYYYIYDEAFHHLRMGYASAAALSLVLILGSLTYLQMRLLKASVSDLG